MTASSQWKIVRTALTATYLLVGWILFSWSLDLVSLIGGVVASVLVAIFTYHIFIDESEAGRRANLPRLDLLLVYAALLVFSMYVSSFKVAWQILRGRINPGVVHFRTRVRSDLARVVLASSITLTPGTITLNLDDDHLIVHWLSVKTTHSRFAGQLIKGRFESLLRRIWI